MQVKMPVNLSLIMMDSVVFSRLNSAMSEVINVFVLIKFYIVSFRLIS